MGLAEEKVRFKHIEHGCTLPNLTRKNENHTRVYYDNDDNRYNSVTKVVGSIDSAGLDRWRESVGESVANYVSIRATTLGSKLHNMVESHLYNKEPDEGSIFAKAHFNNIEPLLRNISNIYGLELRLCSKVLGLAGTADCVGSYKGVPSIIDFKTSSKKKREDWILKYYLQTTAYAIMWEELTGKKIEQIVILITGEDGSREEYIRKRADYEQRLYNIVEEYNK